MQTNFGGHGHSGFRDFAHFSFAFKMAKFPFQTMKYSPWGQKTESAQKIHASRGWCKQTTFGRHSLSSFRDFVSLKNGQISLFDHGLYKIFSSAAIAIRASKNPNSMHFWHHNNYYIILTETYSPWGSKSRIGSKNLFKQRLKRYTTWERACEPSLVGAASLDL